jgi:hypothetical protein
MNSQNEALNMLVQNMGHLAIYPSLKMCPIYSLLHLRMAKSLPELVKLSMDSFPVKHREGPSSLVKKNYYW